MLIDPIADNTYALYFRNAGFISATYNFEVVVGTIFYNRFSVSPVIDFGALRIVLEWSKNPADLDLHLIKEGDYHISYQNMHITKDGTAKLDRDDLDGFGPETITVKAIDNNAVYTCYIKNFSYRDSPDSKALSGSKANIKVYGNNQLLRTYSVLPDQKGTAWMVFTIRKGEIVDKNEMGNLY